jgi:hypothetical protein
MAPKSHLAGLASYALTLAQDLFVARPRGSLTDLGEDLLASIDRI